MLLVFSVVPNSVPFSVVPNSGPVFPLRKLYAEQMFVLLRTGSGPQQCSL